LRHGRFRRLGIVEDHQIHIGQSNGRGAKPLEESPFPAGSHAPSIALRQRGEVKRANTIGYSTGRSASNPASGKCPSLVRASRSCSSRMTTKLEQSVKEYS
jgi:hypothetical protein